MNVGIIGVGGVGGYFGGKICKQAPATGTKVYFVARGRHLDEIRKNGLYVSTAEEGDWVCTPTLATDRIEDLPMLDVCLLCVKSYDLKNAVVQLRDRVSEATFIVPLLNGIDIHERIREDLDTARVLPACVYVGAEIQDYGKVAQTGGARKILMGRDSKHANADLAPVFELFKEADIKYEFFEDVYPEIWGKYVFIAAFGLVTAAFNKTLGEVMDSGPLSDQVLSVMNESVQLSRKLGIRVPETIILDSYQKGRNFPAETKTSFQRDFENMSKPDERDLFGGTILRLGKQWGVDTPVTQGLWDVLNRRKPLAGC
jgi:2-dehydropantoate 2-reductase